MEYILFNRIALIRYVNYLVESLKSCSQKEKNKAEVINMPRIAIVDDQEEYLEEICNLIEKFYFKNGIPYVVNTFQMHSCYYTKWKKNCILIFIY